MLLNRRYFIPLTTFHRTLKFLSVLRVRTYCLILHHLEDHWPYVQTCTTPDASTNKYVRSYIILRFISSRHDSLGIPVITQPVRLVNGWVPGARR